MDKRQNRARRPTSWPSGHLDACGDQERNPQTERQVRTFARTIPGVGPQLAAYLVACTGGSRASSRARLSCHAGVAPFERRLRERRACPQQSVASS
ncbi:MAG: transposase [Flavobacteriales bacterium]|nr:transposase [Flavobacteriales bacterium]